MVKKLLLSQIKENISAYDLVKPGFHVIVGISGGADSVCLLKSITELREEFGLSITAVHVNHMLRGSESDLDEYFVSSLCEEMKVPLRSYQVDVGKVSRASGVSLEEAGRDVRYEIFFRLRDEICADVIAVAHHMDDNAETVLMNIIRGCGLDGLSGMDFKNHSVIRPLLNITRQEILAYLSDHSLAYRTDSSNLSNDFFRNKVRNKLFPYIREQFSSEPVRLLNRLSMLARTDSDYLNEVALNAYHAAHRTDEEGNILFDVPYLLEKGVAISRRLIRFAWENLTGCMKGLELVHIEQISALIKQNVTGKSICLPKEITARISYGTLLMGKITGSLQAAYCYSPNIPGVTTIKEASGALRTQVLNKTDYLSQYVLCELKENATTQIFDYLKINGGINMRNRRNGDRIRPYQSPGEKKLKEFFIDHKIPASRRDNIPLLAVGKQIIWVVGMRTGAEFKIDNDTEQFLILSWTDLSSGG